ncbi:MAG: OB-fold domain-containing protein [Chloroflexi bacterium]|nr:OB-fold domain-containing protein [Chloroflexota bacterium]
MGFTKPLPDVDEDHRAFWDALRLHKFLLWTCKKCSARYWPVSLCRNHPNDPFFDNMEWAEASGRGSVFAFNIHYTVFDPAFNEDVPYVFALIELEEGPLFPSNIVGCAPEEVGIGMPVEVTFEDTIQGFTLPKFRPAKPQRLDLSNLNPYP